MALGKCQDLLQDRKKYTPSHLATGKDTRLRPIDHMHSLQDGDAERAGIPILGIIVTNSVGVIC